MEGLYYDNPYPNPMDKTLVKSLEIVGSESVSGENEDEALLELDVVIDGLKYHATCPADEMEWEDMVLHSYEDIQYVLNRVGDDYFITGLEDEDVD
jgi:hypothetical protein